MDKLDGIVLNRELSNNSYKINARVKYQGNFVRSRDGDRVRHHLTGKQGDFLKITLGFALPKVWVCFGNQSELPSTLSCNPLELEIISNDSEQRIRSPSNTHAQEAIVEEGAMIESPYGLADLLEELSDLEKRHRHRLELKVDRGITQAWLALKQLRDCRLYRPCLPID
ncbi:hypothetical protein [Gloeocapsopsis dulcis]|uniref:Uncharacterized protein n=1 Tax=Gloeocapsopsis dulcis AAB1 = 1H9 TaxID=1433147 RepID=A0A6N8FZ25_9CHRO|nr:hypothetical protein [Gloeocapsopsis dulcis]MUL37882.1 hypothetical protein [Gloeocapsopsis dulcis AAB1 = 1H9]WNN92311.1 hypothetical protein P0S91_25995 [Gloeocapsopsis dulcis]